MGRHNRKKNRHPARMAGITLAVAAGITLGLTLSSGGSVTALDVMSPAAQQHTAIPVKTRQVNAQPSPVQASRTYTVKAGDTLSQIGESQCGSPADWSSLYAANRKAISSPGTIFPGQVLVIAC